MAQDDTVDALVQASFTVIALVSRVAADGETSLTLGRMLGILRDRTPRMADLADHLGLERSTLSGLVDRAEARGLVARRTDETDGRATRVALTSAGRRLAEDGHAEVVASVAPLLAGLSDPERRRLGELLARMLGTPPIDAAPARSR